MVFASGFFHGAETKIQTIGSVPIRNDNLATIGIIGSAPMYLVEEANRSKDEPIEIFNRSQAAAFFGTDQLGYSLPRYIDAIFDQVDAFGGVKLQVINVMDFESPVVSTPTTEPGVTFTESFYIIGGRVDNLVITTTGYVPITLVEGVDYTFTKACSRIDIIPESNDFNVGDTVDLAYDSVTGGNITTVTSEVNTFSSTDTIQLPTGLKELTTLTGTGGTPTYVENTDYTVNLNTGVVTRIPSGTIPFEATVEATYDFFDPSTVVDSQIIGQVLPDGTRTGLEAFRDGFTLYGYLIKILIAPDFSICNSVTSALEVIAETLDCMAVVDAPEGTTYLTATQGRGPAGTINFNYSNDRLILQVPMFKVNRQLTGAVENEYKSARYAGLWANSIIERGFWFSPSNINYRGIVGMEQKIEFIPNRADTEANNLNAAGISTTINFYGAGFREFGNRSSIFPNSTEPRNFIQTKFSEIAINEAIRFVAFNRYVDRPINNDLIDATLDSVNAYLRTLINVGGLIDGSEITYDPVDNPPEQLAQGQVVFRVDLLPPPPAERITFNSFLNIQLLNNLNAGRRLLGAA